MSMSLGGTARQKAEINLTPMIDILLVLIIIFMVITPLTPRGLDTLVPQGPASAPHPAPPDGIVLTVRGDGTVRLNQQPVNISELHARLAAIFQYHPNHVIFVRAEKNLEFRSIAEVVDIARGAGLNRVALMTN